MSEKIKYPIHNIRYAVQRVKKCLPVLESALETFENFPLPPGEMPGDMRSALVAVGRKLTPVEKSLTAVLKNLEAAEYHSAVAETNYRRNAKIGEIIEESHRVLLKAEDVLQLKHLDIELDSVIGIKNIIHFKSIAKAESRNLCTAGRISMVLWEIEHCLGRIPEPEPVFPFPAGEEPSPLSGETGARYRRPGGIKEPARSILYSVRKIRRSLPLLENALEMFENFPGVPGEASDELRELQMTAGKRLATVETSLAIILSDCRALENSLPVGEVAIRTGIRTNREIETVREVLLKADGIVQKKHLNPKLIPTESIEESILFKSIVKTERDNLLACRKMCWMIEEIKGSLERLPRAAAAFTPFFSRKSKNSD
jgi:hypothetical protein